MTPHVRIHGGASLLGDDAEITNLELEIESSDPQNTKAGHVWYNATEKRVKYTESNTNNQSLNRSIATVDDVNAIAYLSVTNIGSRSLYLGQPVYSANGLNVDSANAGNSETRDVVGLVAQNILIPNSVGNIQRKDILSGTISQWYNVTGLASGLIPEASYFLDIVDGHLTSTPPTESGQHFCYIGRALSQTELLIDIQRPIAL